MMRGDHLNAALPGLRPLSIRVALDALDGALDRCKTIDGGTLVVLDADERFSSETLLGAPPLALRHASEPAAAPSRPHEGLAAALSSPNEPRAIAPLTGEAVASVASKGGAPVTRVIRVLADVLGLELAEVRPAAEFASLGMDSLLMVDAVRRLEVEFGCPVPSSAFLEHPTANALGRFLADAVAASPPSPRLVSVVPPPSAPASSARPSRAFGGARPVVLQREKLADGRLFFVVEMPTDDVCTSMVALAPGAAAPTLSAAYLVEVLATALKERLSPPSVFVLRDVTLLEPLRAGASVRVRGWVEPDGRFRIESDRFHIKGELDGHPFSPLPERLATSITTAWLERASARDVALPAALERAWQLRMVDPKGDEECWAALRRTQPPGDDDHALGLSEFVQIAWNFGACFSHGAPTGERLNTPVRLEAVHVFDTGSSTAAWVLRAVRRGASGLVDVTIAAAEGMHEVSLRVAGAQYGAYP
jgi:acyl carrier protein